MLGGFLAAHAPTGAKSNTASNHMAPRKLGTPARIAGHTMPEGACLWQARRLRDTRWDSLSESPIFVGTFRGNLRLIVHFLCPRADRIPVSAVALALAACRAVPQTAQ